LLSYSLIGLVFAGCSPAPRAGVEKQVEGQALFQSACATCHRLPELEIYPFTTSQWEALVQDHRVHNGLDTVLTPQQVQDVARYIVSRMKK